MIKKVTKKKVINDIIKILKNNRIRFDSLDCELLDEMKERFISKVIELNRNGEVFLKSPSYYRITIDFKMPIKVKE
ncbi:MAG: hypothetical protein ACTSPD_10165 [Promethearchaeota archaeon]